MSDNPTRLPKDWEPTVDLISWAKDKLDTTLDALEHETEKFRNYWWSSPGRKGMKQDWPATWRNWMGNTFHRKVSDVPANSERPRRILRPWREAQHEYIDKFTTRVGVSYIVDRKAAFQAYCKDVENGANGVSD